ncbi:hypothetical protein D0T12_07170 [Actinomadura spongiicola]|uniref:Uncharacterized protein n=1 Tax=Actinomadura spongiicola TaxID=2303421 RepID=A0A372GMP8_9ACTN|nr:hypothetical protein D0T12_07170 [Actinomadura spongiicola]
MTWAWRPACRPRPWTRRRTTGRRAWRSSWASPRGPRAAGRAWACRRPCSWCPPETAVARRARRSRWRRTR